MTGAFPFLDGGTPLAFAHRGGAFGGLENSMAAFQRCVDLGYRYLETDVHATSDGVALAFHDAELARMTDRDGRISQLPWRDVAKARIGGREPIVRLDDLLDAWPDVRINLDVKAARAAAPLAAAVRRAAAEDRVCLASFSDARVLAARRMLGPRVCSSPGVRGVAAMRLASYAARAGWLSRTVAPCVQVPLRYRRRPFCDERLIAAAHARGMQVHVWTVDTAAEIHAVLDLGVDGVMTDRPDVLKAVLLARGQWTGR
ncbi:MAG: glycerophosphodiester phosphodiesterase family protein [Geodermatophilaceae bacterium]